MNTPVPIDVEKNIVSGQSLMVKTNRKGMIEYINTAYAELSEYDVDELIGERIDFLLHPDMPATIFDHIWGNLFDKKRTYAIYKNMTKNGKYFWLQVNFDFKVNEDTREVDNIYAYFSKVSLNSKKNLDALYKKVKSIEDYSGVNVAEDFLDGHLDERGFTYQSLIESYLTI